jgi:hypothetical protein
MITMESDQLVDEYLRRLEAAAAHWQQSRRAELVAEIREHIDAALRQEEGFGEAAVRNVLERLGEPEEIVEAAEPPAAEAPGGRRAGALEIIALLALLVPFIGWLVGIVLVFVSEAWARRDKVIGIALLLLVLLVPFVGVTFVSADSGMEEAVPGDARPVGVKEDGGGSDVGFLLLAMLAGLPSALYLGWRLRRHRASGES